MVLRVLRGNRHPLFSSAPTLDDLEREVEVLATRFDERVTAQTTAVAAAFASIEKRLDAMNEFRGALEDQTNRMISRTEALSAVESSASKTNAELGSLRTRLDAYGRPNYLLAISTISAVFGLVAGIWAVIGLKVDNSIAPVSVMIEQLRVNHNAQEHQLNTLDEQMHGVTGSLASIETENAQSILDRQQLNSRIHQFESDLQSEAAVSRQETAALSQRLTRFDSWIEPMKQHLLSEGSLPAGRDGK